MRSRATPPRLTLLVSVHPRYSRLILDGAKTVELRRTRPAVEQGDAIVIYECAPTKALVCQGTIELVYSAPPAKLWRSCGKHAGVSRAHFMQYLADCPTGHAIQFTNLRRLVEPITLQQLRAIDPRFTPPQSYRYLRPDREADRRLVSCL